MNGCAGLAQRMGLCVFTVLLLGPVVLSAQERSGSAPPGEADAAAQESGQPASAPAAAALLPSDPTFVPVTHAFGLQADPLDEGVRLWPELSSTAIMWLAVLVILILTLQTSPLLSIRNLDGLVLAAAALLLAFRFDFNPIGEPGSATRQSTAYSLLAIVLLYWFLRGFFTMRSARVGPAATNVSEGSMLVLIAAVLFIAFTHVATAPLSPAGRAGLIGGMYLAETGTLPYGDTLGFDEQSPLLYLANAGVLRFWSPFIERGAEPFFLTWSNRGEWLQGEWWTAADISGVRLLNAIMVVLTMAGLVWIGKQLHSVAIGLTMMAIYAVFPGSLECFSRPEIMLSTMLLTWSVALALVPGVGGLLAMLLMVPAGLAWPWTWFAAPVMLGYFIRQGWNGVGASVGLLGGLTLCIIGVHQLVRPSLPRYEAAIGHAGLKTTHVAHYGNEGPIEFDPAAPTREVPAGWSKPLWSFLLSADTVGLPSQGLLFREIDADGRAREEIQRQYRAALAAGPDMPRFWASLRTLLESTWLPRTTPRDQLEGAWELWTIETGEAGLWLTIRRCAKAFAAVAALLFAVGMLRLRQPAAYKLMGALLATLCVAMIASAMGAVTNWAWILPLVLATYAAHGATKDAPRPPAAGGQPQRPVSPNVPSGAAPRVSVNN